MSKKTKLSAIRRWLDHMKGIKSTYGEWTLPNVVEDEDKRRLYRERLLELPDSDPNKSRGLSTLDELDGFFGEFNPARLEGADVKAPGVER